eukprot:996093-Prymnesium_polylepis.1
MNSDRALRYDSHQLHFCVLPHNAAPTALAVTPAIFEASDVVVCLKDLWVVIPVAILLPGWQYQWIE